MMQLHALSIEKNGLDKYVYENNLAFFLMFVLTSA